MSEEDQFLQQNPGMDLSSSEGQAAFRMWQNNGGAQAANPFSPTGTNLDAAANQALLSGAYKAAAGGNTYQVQGGNQQGAFQTQGQEAQTQAQQTAQQQETTGTQNQSSTGTMNQAANTTGTSTGITASAGERGVVDTLGFGDLLKQSAPAAQTADASRTGFLTDFVDNGGEGFNGQVDRAVRQSQSGKDMQGTGASAQDRAAAYATEAVAMDNANQRLGASSQLAGPTATQTLASAGNPYLGSTEQGTQVTAGKNDSTTNTTGTSTNNTTGSMSQNTNTLGSSLASSLTNQQQGGVSAANNTQIAAGNQPEQSSSGGGGGSVICTALAKQGLMSETDVHAEANIIGGEYWNHFSQAARGYYLWARPLAKQVRKRYWLARLCRPIAQACADSLFSRYATYDRVAWYKHFVYDATFSFCYFLGWFVRKPAERPATDYSELIPN